MRCYGLPLRAGLAGLMVLAGSALAAAAEIEAGLPENTTTIVSVNLKQLRHAPIVKQHGLDFLRQLCRNKEGVRTTLEAMAFDPFRDLERLTVASVGAGKKAEAVFILHGRFDTARFHIAAKQLVKEHSDRFVIRKDENLKYISVISTGGHGSIVFGTGVNSKKGTVTNVVETKGCLLDAFGDSCLALVDKDTLIAATSEKLLKETCQRIADKDTSTLNKPMRRLLAELDGKQTILFAIQQSQSGMDKYEAADSGATLEDSWKNPPPLPEPPFSETNKEPRKSSLWELSGSISVTEDFTLRCAVRTANADDARVVMKDFEDLRLRADGLMMLLAGSNKEAAFLKEIPRSFAAVRKGRIILVEGRLPADTLIKLLGACSVKAH